MKYQFICSKCKNVFSKELESPFEDSECPLCNIQVRYLGVDSDSWNSLTSDEKVILKEKVLSDYHVMPQTMYLKRLSKDVHTIKNILILSIVLSLVSGILMIVLSGF